MVKAVLGTDRSFSIEKKRIQYKDWQPVSVANADSRPLKTCLHLGRFKTTSSAFLYKCKTKFGTLKRLAHQVATNQNYDVIVYRKVDGSAAAKVSKNPVNGYTATVLATTVSCLVNIEPEKNGFS